MNWEALGAIGELVGAAAVVLTLAYLAAQVRQNSKQMKIAAKQEMTHQFSDYCNMLLANEKIFEIHSNGANNKELNEIDATKFDILMLKAFWYFASMHYQYEAHSLSENDWIQSKSMITNYCHLPGVKAWWKQRTANFAPSFVAFIDSQWDESDV